MQAETIDLTGLMCPIPILRTKQKLAVSASGTVLRLLCTDPQAPEDFKIFASRGAIELLNITETASGSEITIRKKEP
jgi:tRNA 2-thiouridine synthesizing protein A